MVIYFSIYCLLGYFMESLYVSFFQKKWISSGLLKGPFIPLYGIAACILIFVSPYLKDSLVMTLLAGGILMTSLEYLAGLFIEKVFQTKCWDYSHHHFQLHGRICLIYFIMWCLLSWLFIFYLHPLFLSLPLMNDTICVLCLIYQAFILKAFIERLQLPKKDGLDIN